MVRAGVQPRRNNDRTGDPNGAAAGGLASERAYGQRAEAAAAPPPPGREPGRWPAAARGPPGRTALHRARAARAAAGQARASPVRARLRGRLRTRAGSRRGWRQKRKRRPQAAAGPQYGAFNNIFQSNAGTPFADLINAALGPGSTAATAGPRAPGGARPPALGRW
ncbi:hypothetical protein MNEG_7829 [Monoraphidium neglectum]|uniref:Uncharacterized protein n=1 Tax=Monoraphidium neglectum TaxID=145388 RepID=A0A0D2N1L7_9CHLO|nr:hypothetical protein MNEG_7829 [Monoraphidium neglectum]KIZ00136.1 hypothetical protein MNEG_7829 [Monoraphidium neglectum]|eukprot:XP_013899155.1 hypothetical protein MNEG_7829 [Monoraphidium neglectum]